MRFIITIGFGFFSVTAASQAGEFAVRMRQYASGEVTPFIVTNPAALSKADRLSVTLNAGKAFMLVPEMLLTANIPAGKSAFGLGLNYRGSPFHRETEPTIAYGRKLSENISAGLGFGYFQSRIPGYINGVEGSITGGVLFRITTDLITGMDIRKRVGFSGIEKFRGSLYHAGIGYTISEVLLIVIEVEKEEEHPAFFRSGLQYRFHKELYATTGIATDTGTWFFGSGFRFSTFTTEAVFAFHPSLGWSPSLTLVFEKRKK